MKSRKVMLRLFLVMAIATVGLVAFQSGTQRFAHIVAKKITVNGASGLIFAVGDLDLNGIAQLILDADGDTSLTADTDDQIDVEVGGADEFIFTAGVFDVGNGTVGRIDLDADNDTSIRSRVDDTIDLEIGGTDEYSFTATVFDIGNGTPKRIDLDADGDTSIRSNIDDSIAFETSASNRVLITTDILDIAATGALPMRIDMDDDNDTSVRSSADDQIDFELGGADVITFTAAAARFDANVEVASDLIAGVQTAITFTVGARITPTGTYQALTTGPEATPTSTTDIAEGSIAGELLILHNLNATNVITIDGTGTTVECKADVVLAPRDTLMLIWDGADWRCLSSYDNS